MNDNEPIEKKRKNPSAPRGRPRRKICTVEQRLQAVRLHLEEGFTIALVAQEMGVSTHAVDKWLRRYRSEGEEGLKDRFHGPRTAKLPEPVRDKILELKKADPTRGIKRISQLLKRVFFLKASSETVRRTLHQEDLIESPPKPRRNLVRPRFFERATPNQMWQTDIFTFRLGGRYAYLIGFMDDYSRYLVGADVFRSQTAENVLEVFRVAMSEYNPPREMLTDNGRQYTTWRGTSRFEAELKKSGIAHFKSRPHHPMTLGKIERFWETIWQEFLSRAQFESFESARERIRLWIKYYNHKRPHQGIEGLCPADRFFEVASQLRKTIASGIQDNLLEMALRGQPKAPFYMVGRMEGQSVILRAEKGKLKLSIDNGNENKELTYDLHQQDPSSASTSPLVPGHRKGPGGPGSVDRPVPGGGCLPPTQDQLHDLSALAAAGDGGHAPSLGEPGEPHQGGSPEPPLAGVAPASATDGDGGQTHPPVGPDKQGCQPGCASGKNGLDECQSPTTGGADPASALRPDDGQGCRRSIGHLPSAILPMGTTGVAGAADRAGRPADRPPQEAGGPGEGTVATPGTTTGTTSPTAGTQGATAPAPEPLGGEGRPATR
jgi:transposase InsO family protein